jgi:hypothetical protein
MRNMARAKILLWAIDCETDPFKYGREPIPFAWGAVCENGECVTFWGDDATAQFIAWAHTIPKGLMLAHNGGKFDALFLRDGVAGNMLVIDGRIVKCNFLHHELRDSFAILPSALAKLGAKGNIDYTRLEREVREQHREEITRYMMQDCVVLLDAVMAFYQAAGKRRLTVASTAFAALKQTEQGKRIVKMSAAHDAQYRRFYYGGRVQYFAQGIIKKDLQLYDVNSMYPAVMKNCLHPLGAGYDIKRYDKSALPRSGAYFADIECDSLGAFPVRHDNGSVSYAQGRVKTSITGHELNAAIGCGIVSDVSGILYIPHETIEFSEFVDKHYNLRMEHKAAGDSAGDMFNKLMLNSAYGKLASSPEGKEELNYMERGEIFTRAMRAEGWRERIIDHAGERIIAGRPVQRPQDFYNDVGTGASITGAARSVLMRAISNSHGVVYCDTDSILCEEFNGGEVDDNKLGAWKKELDCDTAAIAGKKLYVLLNNKRPVKYASKGVRACPTEIYQAAAGEAVRIDRDAPTIGLRGMSFISREIRAT